MAQARAQLLGFPNMALMDCEGYNGGIWCLWDDNIASVSLVERNHQFLHFLISSAAGSGDLQSLLQGLSGKPGVLSASKDSIQAMFRVVVTDKGTDCLICLETYEVSGEAREMPCKHKFHSGCIEKWLRLHWSCPIYRYAMSKEDEITSIAVNEGKHDDNERRESDVGLVSVSAWVRSLDEDEEDNYDDDPMKMDSDPDHGSRGANNDSREGNLQGMKTRG
ncbi:hypothetical protein K1719_006831 [Acacia pycnantha]|nr:hypothetical protein K1719_006831 [Acacia pycnantha]